MYACVCVLKSSQYLVSNYDVSNGDSDDGDRIFIYSLKAFCYNTELGT